MRLQKVPREDAVLVKSICFLLFAIPLLSCMCGNAIPGAPVKASMSGEAIRNQGGTVEYICIPPLIFIGGGYFYAFPQIDKEEKL